MIDKILAVVALLQTAVTTLRAGSRALYILRTGGIGVMDGPSILPPRQNNESAFLWEVSTAFRHAVLLEARPDLYETEFVDTPISDDTVQDGYRDTYPLSPFGSPRRSEDENLDDSIEEILLQDEEEDFEIYNNGLQEELVLETTGKFGNFNSSDDGSVLPSENDSSGLFQIIKRVLGRGGTANKLGKFDEENQEGQFIDDTSNDIVEKETNSAVSYRTQVEVADDKLSSPKKVSVRVFAPEIFHQLRGFFGISEPKYLHSILESGPFVSFQSNSKGAARVGGVFFFTRDGTYLIKTIKRDEVGSFLKILTRYHNFMKENGRRSLLTRFCGMYEIEMPTSDSKSRRETFVVMNSVFPVQASKLISERFDLKGSTLGRECSPDEKLSKGSSAILKDLDLAKEVDLLMSLRHHKGPKDISVGLHLGPTSKAVLLKQLRRDVQLLVDCNLIDYSLLVGVMTQTSAHPSVYDLVVASFSDGIDRQLPKRKSNVAVRSLFIPVKFLAVPPLLLARTALTAVRRLFTWESPYYGSEVCGVDAGALSRIKGERLGQKAVYYFGLIDFLQPFNWKKELEWRWKRLQYGEGFSCVPPEEYAQRFLKYMDTYIT